MLPSSCKTLTINPRTIVNTSSINSWNNTDLQYSLVLSKLSHVIIMYQLSGFSPHDDYHIVTRIKLKPAIEKHTVYHSAYKIIMETLDCGRNH